MLRTPPTFSFVFKNLEVKIGACHRHCSDMKLEMVVAVAQVVAHLTTNRKVFSLNLLWEPGFVSISNSQQCVLNRSLEEVQCN